MKKLISLLLTVTMLVSLLVVFENTEDKKAKNDDKKDKSDVYADEDDSLGEYYHYPDGNNRMIGYLAVSLNKDFDSYKKTCKDMENEGYYTYEKSDDDKNGKNFWSVHCKFTEDANEAIRDIKVFIGKKDEHPDTITENDLVYYLVGKAPASCNEGDGSGVVSLAKESSSYYAYMYVCRDAKYGPPITSIRVKDSDNSYEDNPNLFNKDNIVTTTSNSYCEGNEIVNFNQGSDSDYKYMSYKSDNYNIIKSKDLRKQLEQSKEFKNNLFVKKYYEDAKRCVDKLDDAHIVDTYSQADINALYKELKLATAHAKIGWGKSYEKAYKTEVGDCKNHKYIGYIATYGEDKKPKDNSKYIPLKMNFDSDADNNRFCIGYSYTNNIKEAIRNIKFYVSEKNNKKDVLFETVNGKQCKFYLVGKYPATISEKKSSNKDKEKEYSDSKILSQEDADGYIDLGKESGSDDKKLHIYMYVSKDINSGAPITDITAFSSKSMIIVDEDSNQKELSYAKTFKISDKIKDDVLNVERNEYNKSVYLAYRGLQNVDSSKLRETLEKASKLLKKENAYSKISRDGLEKACEEALRVIISLDSYSATPASQDYINSLVDKIEYHISVLEPPSFASIFASGYFIYLCIFVLLVIVAIIIMIKKGKIKVRYNK